MDWERHDSTASAVEVQRREGYYDARPEWQPAEAIILVYGVPRIRIDEEPGSSRSWWLHQAPYRNSDITCDAPFRFEDAITHWVTTLSALYDTVPELAAA